MVGKTLKVTLAVLSNPSFSYLDCVLVVYISPTFHGKPKDEKKPLEQGNLSYSFLYLVLSHD